MIGVGTFDSLWMYCGIYRMVFTVSPAAHVRCPSDVGSGGEGASAVSSGFFSEDLSVYYYCGHLVSVDPFSASVVDHAGDGNGGG